MFALRRSRTGLSCLGKSCLGLSPRPVFHTSRGYLETKEGLANIEAICATPGLDAIYIGPSDLAFAIGKLPKPDNTDPLHLEACHRIRDAAHRHGKKACMHCASGAFAAGAVARGFDLVMLTSDVLSLVSGVRKQLDDFKAGVKSVS